MTKDELNKIRKRWEEATGELWVYAETAEGWCVLDEDSDLICGEFEREQDARFTACARWVIPELLDYIEELEYTITKMCPIADFPPCRLSSSRKRTYAIRNERNEGHH